MLKVSVIVPVYNPGANIDECISSLLGQSLPPDEYEVIFVDDGSTDETPARLDELAREHSHVRVEHIPNSGWPGRPRNVGIDLAQGEFVYFVDNDDWLGRRALERLHAVAVRNRSDVVIGKVVGHDKPVPRTLFRRSHAEVTLEWPPLVRLLTPHKLFRKALLDEHGIRFPEGRRRLEDHLFVMHAYFHARRITVLADYPCYHWVMRERGANASFQAFDPAVYYDNVREVLDLVDEHTEPGPLRDQLYTHWYRGKMLGRVGGAKFLRRDPDYRRKLYEEIRGLALERYGPEVHARLRYHLRVRSRLLREGGYEALQALAAFESELGAKVRTRELRWDDGTLALRLEATLTGRDPLELVQRGGRVLWRPPEALRDALGDDDLDLTEELAKSRVQVLLHSRANKSEYTVPTRSELVLLGAPGRGDGKRPGLVATAEIARDTVAAGSRLPAGRWDVRAVLDVGGFNTTAGVIASPGSWLPGFLGRGASPVRLSLVALPDGRLLRRVPVRYRLARRLSHLKRLLKRARRRGGAATAT